MNTQNKQHEVQFEIAGPAAMFTRPDTGGTPTSYPVPTWSAAKGLFESVAFFEDGSAWIYPTKVEVCRRVGEAGGRVHFQKYTNNYGGPLRKHDLFNKGMTSGGSSMQLFATILSDVCYRLYGVAVSSQWKRENNPRHHLQDLFDRRLKRGECFRTPCLGWSEFACSYWGPFRTTTLLNQGGTTEENKRWKSFCEHWNIPFRDETEVDADFSTEIPSMLVAMWNVPSRGKYEPVFQQDVKISHGVLEYKRDMLANWLSRPDKEVMQDAQ